MEFYKTHIYKFVHNTILLVMEEYSLSNMSSFVYMKTYFTYPVIDSPGQLHNATRILVNDIHFKCCTLLYNVMSKVSPMV